MAEVAERHTRNAEAAAVVLSLVHSPFAVDVPIAVIRRRWPRLYPYARSAAERLKALAGGAEVPSPAGWPYRFTRWCVARAIGQEPEVLVEDAVRYTTETLDGLLRLEDIAVICGFFMRLRDVPGNSGEAQRHRVDTFKARVREYCNQRHVELFDRDVALASAGRKHAVSDQDAAYGDLQTREFAADLIAKHVVASLFGVRGS
jgi:hypothetical protein